MNHFPLMNMNKCLCRFIDKILSPCRTDDRPKKSTINWLKVSLLETDIDDPFLFTNFTTLHTLGHTREMWKRQHKKAKQNSVQSTKQNTSMKSKLCCKNSMLRGFICRLRSENSEKTVLALFTFEKFMSLFSSRFPLSKLLLGLFVAALWHGAIVFATMNSVYMIHDETLMQKCLDRLAAAYVELKCSWLGTAALTGRNPFTLRLIHAGHLHRAPFAINLAAKGFITPCKNIHQTRKENFHSVLHIAGDKS